MKWLRNCLLILFLWILLSWCWKKSPNVISLPPIFDVVPSNFDQLLYLDIDEDLISLLQTQYWENTPIIDEFRKISQIAVWQRGGNDPQSLLFFDAEELNINQLSALWIVPLDDTYQLYNIQPWIQVYGQKSVVESQTFQGSYSWELFELFADKIATNRGNFSFISLPIGEWLAWLALQFGSKLQWTIWTFDLWLALPTWDAYMLFKEWVIKDSNQSWTSRVSNEAIPISVSTNWIVKMLWLDSMVTKSMLPLLLGQLLWDSFSLLSQDDLDTIITALWGSLTLEILPSLLWTWWRLIADNVDVYRVFDSLFPVLDWTIKARAFSWSVIEEEKTASSMKRTNTVSVWSWEVVWVPILEITQGADYSQFSMLFVDEIPLWDQSKSNPWSTVATALIDIELLAWLMGLPVGEIFIDADTDMMSLELSTDASENLLHLEVK